MCPLTIYLRSIIHQGNGQLVVMIEASNAVGAAAPNQNEYDSDDDVEVIAVTSPIATPSRYVILLLMLLLIQQLFYN